VLKALDSYLLINFFQPVSFLLEKMTGKNNFFWAKVSVITYTVAFCGLVYIIFGQESTFLTYALVILLAMSGVARTFLLNKKEKGESFPGSDKLDERGATIRKIALVLIPFLGVLLLARVLLVPDLESVIWLVWMKAYVFAMYFEICIPIPTKKESNS